jgi:O-antigen/teichoic acid export membrane protein
MGSIKSKLSVLVKDSTVYMAGEALTRVIGFILIPIFTRVFIPADYGVIDLITIFISVIAVLLIMGMDSAVARFYYDDPEDDHEIKVIFSTGFLWEIGTSLAICLSLIMLSGKISTLVLKDNSYRLYVLLAICSIPFIVWRQFFANLLKWKREKYRYLILAISEVIIRPSLKIYLVVFLHRGITGVFVANLISYMAIFLLGLVITYKNYSLKFSYPLLKKLLSYGLPYAIIGVSMQVMVISDKYFLNYYTSLRDVGLYTVGQRMASIASLLVVGFQTAWGPFALYVHKDRNAKRIYSKVFEYYIILTSVMFAFLTIFSREIILLLSTREYAGGADVMGILTFNVVLNGVYALYCIGVGITKKSYYSGIAVISGMLANLILNFLLVPRFTMRGAAVATVLANLVSVILIRTFSQRVYHVNYRMSRILSTLALSFAVIGIASVVPEYSLFINILSKSLLMIGLISAIIFSPIMDPDDREFILSIGKRVPILLSRMH